PSKRVFPIRAVEDHHVDRPGVEAQQCVKLTGTNSSIGLIVLINQCPYTGQNQIKSKSHNKRFSLTLWFLRGAQYPIPSRTRPSNPSAPMVLSLKTWESRSLQGLPKTLDLSTIQNNKSPGTKCRGFRAS